MATLLLEAVSVWQFWRVRPSAPLNPSPCPRRSLGHSLLLYPHPSPTPTRTLSPTHSTLSLTLQPPPYPPLQVESLGERLHAREHFAVNVAVAGGLLLIQEVGGGRFTVDELMKKAA